jgi:hypothetical protein
MQLGAAIAYALEPNFGKCLYWSLAAALTVVVFFMM